jgi:hypothetical protein
MASNLRVAVVFASRVGGVVASKSCRMIQADSRWKCGRTISTSPNHSKSASESLF